MFACLIDMSYLLLARGIDIRMLKESQIEDGRIRIKPSKTQKTSGKAVDIIVTPEIAEVIARARGLKIKYGLDQSVRVSDAKRRRIHPLVPWFDVGSRKGAHWHEG